MYLIIIPFAEVKKADSALQDSLKREAEGLKARVAELEEQNKGLVEQFTQVSDKMAAVQNKLLGKQVGLRCQGTFVFDELKYLYSLRYSMAF